MALKNIKVVDLSRLIAGPYCGMLLADMGAEVIKVEKPIGEDTRHVPPLVESDSLYTSSLNRNKRAVTIDFRHEQAKPVLKRMFEWADIIIENFRPGTLEKMGFSPEYIHEFNPRAIIVRCSGFGQTGPYKSRPGFDPIAQAMGGIMSLTGKEEDPPLMCGTSVIDYTTGLNAAVGALSALHSRHDTDKGQVVDVSLYESAVSMLLSAIPNYYINKTLPERTGNQDRYSAPANTYKAKDGWVYINAFSDKLWAVLCESIGKEKLKSDARFNTVSKRVDNVNEINKIIDNWVKTRTKNDIVNYLTEKGVPCGPVQNVDEILKDEHLLEREQIIYVEHPTAGEIPLSGINAKLSNTPGKIRYHPPLVGEHNKEVYLNEFSFTNEEYDILLKNKVI